MILTLDEDDEALYTDPQGTVVLMNGRMEDGQLVDFACDWRMAQGILEALEEEGVVSVNVEDYQILSWLGPIDSTEEI